MIYTVKEGGQMDSKNTIRRDKGMLFLTDESLAEQLNDARRLIQRINSIDISDIDGINAGIGADRQARQLF